MPAASWGVWISRPDIEPEQHNLVRVFRLLGIHSNDSSGILALILQQNQIMNSGECQPHVPQARL